MKRAGLLVGGLKSTRSVTGRRVGGHCIVQAFTYGGMSHRPLPMYRVGLGGKMHRWWTLFGGSGVWSGRIYHRWGGVLIDKGNAYVWREISVMLAAGVLKR